MGRKAKQAAGPRQGRQINIGNLLGSIGAGLQAFGGQLRTGGGPGGGRQRAASDFESVARDVSAALLGDQRHEPDAAQRLTGGVLDNGTALLLAAVGVAAWQASR